MSISAPDHHSQYHDHQWSPLLLQLCQQPLAEVHHTPHTHGHLYCCWESRSQYLCHPKEFQYCWNGKTNELVNLLLWRIQSFYENLLRRLSHDVLVDFVDIFSTLVYHLLRRQQWSQFWRKIWHICVDVWVWFAHNMRIMLIMCDQKRHFTGGMTKGFLEMKN